MVCRRSAADSSRAAWMLRNVAQPAWRSKLSPHVPAINAMTATERAVIVRALAAAALERALQDGSLSGFENQTPAGQGGRQTMRDCDDGDEREYTEARRPTSGPRGTASDSDRARQAAAAVRSFLRRV